MTLPKTVYIVAAKRTPVGRFQGSLKTLSGPQLGAIAVKQHDTAKPHLKKTFCCGKTDGGRARRG